jgi:tetratricopeptide (TPR) repeat protein
VTAKQARVSDGHGPYVGLRAYTTSEHDLFFGRARESLEIARLWRARKLTLLYGASGVGKTSLLQAGVIATLDPERTDFWRMGRLRPSHQQIAVRARNPYTFALLSSWAPGESPGTLAETTISEFLARRRENHDRYGDPIPLLVAIDQFEELFSNPDTQGYLRLFIDELANALHDHEGARLLLSLREDYLASVLPFEQLLAGQSRTRSRLLPFGPDAALEAISGPLKGTGRSFDQAAAEELVADLRTVRLTSIRGEERTVTVDSIEPVQVQIVCSALWESLPRDATIITSADVREHANVDRFLASFCSHALSAVASEHGIAAAKIRSWLQQEFITELGTRGTAYQGRDQTAGMPNAVVWALEDRHILRAELRSNTRWYELQHDRLIDPILQADPEEHLAAAKLARGEGAWDLVQHHATRAIRMFGADELRVRAEAERLLGEAAQHLGQADVALDRYHMAAGLFEVVQDSTAVGESMAAAGRLSLARGRHAAAARDLQAAIARIPADLRVQTDLAQALWHTGQQMAALAVLNSVLALDSTLTQALRARGEILADMGKAEEALSDLDLDRVRHQQQPGTQAARALALALGGRFDAAEQEAADALANSDDHGPVLLRVAGVRASTGKHTEAIHLAAAALAATETRLPPHLRERAQRLLDEQQRIDNEPENPPDLDR